MEVLDSLLTHTLSPSLVHSSVTAWKSKPKNFGCRTVLMCAAYLFIVALTVLHHVLNESQNVWTEL